LAASLERDYVFRRVLALCVRNASSAAKLAFGTEVEPTHLRH
jgi:hypothetical protein